MDAHGDGEMTIPRPIIAIMLAALPILAGHTIAKAVIGAEIAVQEVKW